MFSLNDDLNYWLYNQPCDLRKSYNSLSGFVVKIMHRNVLNGDAFIFINRNRNKMKILKMESGGLVLFCKNLEQGYFYTPDDATDQSQINIEWNR